MRAARGRWLLAAWACVAAAGATNSTDDGSDDDDDARGARSEDSLTWAVGFAFMAFVARAGAEFCCDDLSMTRSPTRRPGVPKAS